MPEPRPRLAPAVAAGGDRPAPRAFSACLDGRVQAGEPLPVCYTVRQAAWNLAAARIAVGAG